MCLDKIKSKRYPVDPIDDHRRFLENLPAEQKKDYSDEILMVRKALKSLPQQ